MMQQAAALQRREALLAARSQQQRAPTVYAQTAPHVQVPSAPQHQDAVSSRMSHNPQLVASVPPPAPQQPVVGMDRCRNKVITFLVAPSALSPYATFDPEQDKRAAYATVLDTPSTSPVLPVVATCTATFSFLFICFLHFLVCHLLNY